MLTPWAFKPVRLKVCSADPRPLTSWKAWVAFFFFPKILKFYSWETQRETAETQAEGEAGFLQGAWCGTRSQDPGIIPWATQASQKNKVLKNQNWSTIYWLSHEPFLRCSLDFDIVPFLFSFKHFSECLQAALIYCGFLRLRTMKPKMKSAVYLYTGSWLIPPFLCPVRSSGARSLQTPLLKLPCHMASSANGRPWWRWEGWRKEWDNNFCASEVPQRQ